VSDSYVLTLSPTDGGDLDLTSLRARSIADAQARFRRMAGDEVVDPDSADDATVTRWARWLIERLEAAGSIYERSGEGWRLRSAKLHERSEQALGGLDGWSEPALAGQRRLLEHVDDPGDSGNELEQSLSKLAAAGWSVDSKKDKGTPAVHYAAGDLPLATGDDWRADGAIHPRLAAALARLAAAVASAERESAPPGDVAGRLPALAIVAPGETTDVALLDLRTVAKALRDANAIELPGGEPLGPVLTVGNVYLRATKRKRGGQTADAAANGGPAAADAGSAAPGGDAAAPNGGAPDAGAPVSVDPNDATALVAAKGEDAVRFALLHCASPEKRFRGGEDVVGYAAAFLADVGDLAATRLDGSTPAGTRIDADDDLRRRLAGWCDTALARSAENHARIEPHRATRNALALLARIRDFDARAAELRGEVAGADRAAVAVALALLAQLLAPLAPAAAADLWRRAGRDGAPGDAPWPTAQREPAAAA
jgi:hypothetical protein